LTSIYFVTGSCIGCPSSPVEGGLKIRLDGSNGKGCQTDGGLDHVDIQDYVSGTTAVFAGEEELTSCYLSDLGGAVQGGAVTWLSSGMFAARNREICLMLAGDNNSSWCCDMESGYSAQNVPVELVNCKIVV